MTGAAGLIYQVTWQRYFSRLLGSDTLATAVVLGIFLGGLSLGYLVTGRLTVRVRNLLGVYGLLELLIGVWGLAFPLLFRGVEIATGSWSFSLPWGLSLQGTLCAAILIGPPALAMGGTVPILTRALTSSLEHATPTQSRIYAINTFGAFVGVLAAGFALIPWLGLPGTVRVAAALNLAAGGFFLWRSRYSTPLTNSAAPIASARSAGPDRRAVLAIAFLSGVYVMTLESLLIRVTGLSLGSNSYSFALIVAAFVLAIAVGADRAGRRPNLPSWSLLATQGAIAVTLLGLLATLDTWPYGAHLLRIGFQGNALGFAAYQLGALLLLLLLLGVPVALMGATLPLAFHAVQSRVEQVGNDVGRLFAANAAGSLLGALAGGFIAYRWFSIHEIFVGVIVLVVVSMLLAGFGLQRTRWGSLAVGAGVVIVAALTIGANYEPQRFAMGTFRLRTPQPYSFDGPARFFDQFLEHRQVIVYDDGPEGSFAVVETTGPGTDTLPPFLQASLSTPDATSRMIMVNAKSDSDTSSDRETLKLAAHLPLLLGGSRERVLVIGLGTGVTVGEVGLHPDVQVIDVAEISSTVVDYLPHFDDYTHGIRQDPRLRIHVRDAFHLLRRSHEKWDVIIVEPSNPWVSGVDQLFSREFFQLARQRLKDGGVLLQWLQRYETSDAIRAIAINTLRTEFPHLRIFRGRTGDDLFLSSLTPIPEEAIGRVDGRLRDNPDLRRSLETIGIASGEDLLSRRQDDILQPAAAALERWGLETLDHPQIHYLSGYAFFTGGTATRRQVVFSF